MFPHHAREQYERTLRAEIRAHRWDWLPETIYFGGGTPSLMRLEFLAELMAQIPRERVTEITLECAPGTITPHHAQAWRECGVNRVSLGVQSFETAELRQTGRRHDAQRIESDVSLLRKAGLDNINIDLIAGLPGQTSRSWQHSLHWLERLAPPHASVYIFEIDEDSRLGKEILRAGDRYGARQVPDDDLTAGLYEHAVDRFAAMGLARYEISNFARPGFESRHNLKYWQLEPYVGFGMDAHSFNGTHRWSNPDTLEEYFARWENGVAGPTERAPADPAEEHFFVGLRLMRGIEPTLEEWSRFAQPIAKHLHTGLLHQEGARLHLSGRGVLLSNEVFEEFVNA